MAPPAPHLVDEILEEIFLRLPTLAALARASTASPSFRSIITERSFLRRFRKLHPPPLLGFAAAERAVFVQAQDPHPSAPLARALADAADFTYSFVPRPENCSFSTWHTRDVRDGRVLLEWVYGGNTNVFTNLAVCDPLSRRYVLLPPIPEDMTAQPEPLVQFDPFLAPAAEDEDETMFKVICTASYQSKLAVFVFSSAPGQWSQVASPSWSSLGINTVDVLPTPWRKPYYLSGCIYWEQPLTDKLLLLDACRMEFSTVNGYGVPLINQIDHGIHTSSIVIGTEGALEMITLIDSRPKIYIYHTFQENNGESGNKCQLKNVVALPSSCFLYRIVGATEGFLFLRGVQRQGPPAMNFYSLEVKTFEVKEVCRGADYRYYYLYFGFPPSLSNPSL